MYEEKKKKGNITNVVFSLSSTHISSFLYRFQKVLFILGRLHHPSLSERNWIEENIIHDWPAC